MDQSYRFAVISGSALFYFAFIGLAIAQPTPIYCVTGLSDRGPDNFLVVRFTPNLRSQWRRDVQLRNGDCVQVLEEQGDFYRVRVGGRIEGWSAKIYLQTKTQVGRASSPSLLATGSAQAQNAERCYDDVNRIENTTAFRAIISWLGSDVTKIVPLQLALHKDGGYKEKIDGKVGSGTKVALCASLNSYSAIGSGDRSWTISSERDAPKFMSWLYAAIISNETGSEFPD